jgi:hypothetical protein
MIDGSFRMIGTNFTTLFCFITIFSGSLSFAEMSAHKIIEKARVNITSGTAIVEDYACSTRTAAFMKNELLDIYERYDVNKYAFTLVDDWASSINTIRSTIVIVSAKMPIMRTGTGKGHSVPESAFSSVDPGLIKSSLPRDCGF